MNERTIMAGIVTSLFPPLSKVLLNKRNSF
eukprot:COSAG01_NODE_57350_length_312_cov_28.718310_1_plen_29_part_10